MLEWIQPCANHLTWCATTTFSGNGLVIWAKFKSFFGHVTNKHTNHPDPLFDKCAHEENIQSRKWLHEGKCVMWCNYCRWYFCMSWPNQNTVLYLLSLFLIYADSIAFVKMHAALTKKSLVSGVKKASPMAQTSCLEGFHSVVNQFAPKMICYSYPGMFCRYVCYAVPQLWLSVLLK